MLISPATHINVRWSTEYDSLPFRQVFFFCVYGARVHSRMPYAQKKQPKIKSSAVVKFRDPAGARMPQAWQAMPIKEATNLLSRYNILISPATHINVRWSAEYDSLPPKAGVFFVYMAREFTRVCHIYKKTTEDKIFGCRKIPWSSWGSNPGPHP